MFSFPPSAAQTRSIPTSPSVSPHRRHAHRRSAAISHDFGIKPGVLRKQRSLELLSTSGSPRPPAVSGQEPNYSPRSKPKVSFPRLETPSSVQSAQPSEAPLPFSPSKQTVSATPSKRRTWHLKPHKHRRAKSWTGMFSRKKQPLSTGNVTATSAATPRPPPPTYESLGTPFVFVGDPLPPTIDLDMAKLSSLTLAYASSRSLPLQTYCPSESKHLRSESAPESQFTPAQMLFASTVYQRSNADLFYSRPFKSSKRKMNAIHDENPETILEEESSSSTSLPSPRPSFHTPPARDTSPTSKFYDSPATSAPPQRRSLRSFRSRELPAPARTGLPSLGDSQPSSKLPFSFINTFKHDLAGKSLDDLGESRPHQPRINLSPNSFSSSPTSSVSSISSLSPPKDRVKSQPHTPPPSAIKHFILDTALNSTCPTFGEPGPEIRFRDDKLSIFSTASVELSILPDKRSIESHHSIKSPWRRGLATKVWSWVVGRSRPGVC